MFKKLQKKKKIYINLSSTVYKEFKAIKAIFLYRTLYWSMTFKCGHLVAAETTMRQDF